MQVAVAAFYQFAKLPEFRAVQAPLLAQLKSLGARGSILLAGEGVNGTIAVLSAHMPAALDAVREQTGLALADVKYSASAALPFKRMKVRLKAEIVTLGPVHADPTESVGAYVEAADWNALIEDPETIVIDTRNSYEFAIGTFRNAIDPATESFSAFPDWVQRNLAEKKHRRIAMFCTGGIRCEKATSFLKHEGFDNVFHLKGGILKYLEIVPEKDSLWAGGCFVFDERVAVGHGLVSTGHSICHGCLMPVSAAQRSSPLYEEGVSCPACAGHLTEAQRASNRERQRQFTLGKARGRKHLGPMEG